MNFQKEEVEEIKEIQNRYPVEKWTIENIHVWPIVRLALRKQSALQKDGNVTKEKNDSIWISRIRYIWKLIVLICKINYYRLMDWKHNDTLDCQADILCLTFSVYRATRINKLYYLRNLQSFLNTFPKATACIMELVGERGFLFPRYGKSVLIDDMLLISLLKQHWDFFRLRKRPLHSLEQYLPQWDAAVSDLSLKGYKVLSLSDLESQVRAMIAMKNFFVEIIKKIQPKLIILECFYHTICESLILACNELNIPSADLQHGIQPGNHTAYSLWKPTSSGYSIFPRYFLNWSEMEKESIERWNYLCPNKHSSLPIGNLWEEAWRQLDLPSIFKPYIYLIQQVQEDHEHYNILFSMDYDFPHITIINLINQSPESWRWWIRMHPVTYSKWNKYKSEFKKCLTHKNCNIEQASEWPLPALLKFTSLQVTERSSITFECAEMGIPSILMDPSVMEGYEEYSSWIHIIPMEKLTLNFIREVMAKKYAKRMHSSLTGKPAFHHLKKLLDQRG